MNSHVRVESIQAHAAQPAQVLRIKRRLPDWFAAAMLLVAGALTIAWASFLIWLPGYLTGIW